MLRNAATLEAELWGSELSVKIINESGHKLPTGYVEGRRMWLEVRAWDAEDSLVYHSGAYDLDSAELSSRAGARPPMIYEAKHGLSAAMAEQSGLKAGPSFNFIFNDRVLSDNRIPPRGYEFEAFREAGAAPYSDGRPDPSRYADGQYWDEQIYPLPAQSVRVAVRLLYQQSSKEYIEFLRDNNPNSGDPGSKDAGALLHSLWENTGKSPPVAMAEISVSPNQGYLPLLSSNFE